MSGDLTPTTPDGRGLPSVLFATGFSSFGPLPPFLLGGLAVLVRAELRFSEARLGLSVAVFFAFASLSSAPAGRLADRLGAVRVLRIGLLASLMALTTIGVVGAWWQLTVALAVAGIGHAVLQVAANLLIADDVAPRHQGLAFGIKQSAIPLATLAGGAAVPLIGTQYGWRWAYGGAAALAAIALVAQSQLRTRVRTPTVRTERPRPPAPFDRRQLLTLAVAVGLGAGAANALPAFLVEFAAASGMPLARAGSLLAVVSVAGLVTRVSIGWGADRHGAMGLGVVAGLLFAGSAGFALLPLVDATSPLLWLAATVAFAGGWAWPGLFVFVVARQNAHMPAAATGTTQAGIFAGAVVGPLLFGFAASDLSYTVAWTGAAVAQLLGALLVLTARRSWRRTAGNG